MNPYLFPGLEGSCKAVCHLLRQLDRSALDRPTHPGRFTPREVAAHLADWEPILREERIRTGVERPGSPIVAYDEGQRAIERGYASADLEETLRVFAEEREKTIAYLRSLPKNAFAHTVIHPERGEMTVDDLANMFLGHDLYHVHQLLDVS